MPALQLLRPDQADYTQAISALKNALRGGELTSEAKASHSVAEVVRGMEAVAPGFAFYVCDELGRLRQHVNIYVGGERVSDRATLSDPVEPGSRVLILQALSGG